MLIINPRLPKGYTELEYIQSSGEQYIDTGINSADGLKIKVKFSVSEVSGSNYVFGANSVGGKSRTQFLYTSSMMWCGWGDSYQGNIPRNIDTSAHVIEASNVGFVFDDVQIYTPSSDDFSVESSIPLFATKTSPDGSVTIFSNGLKIYLSQIYFGSTLVRDLVPCIHNSDSAVGMYDLVSQAFFGNAGMGTFTAGKKVRFVKGVAIGEKTVKEIAWKPGINLWDEQWESGTYDKDTGEKKPQAGAFRSVDYIAVNPSTEYYCFCGSQGIRVYYYQEDKTYIGTALADDSTITTPSNCHFMTFYSGISTYNHDICINLSDPDINGHYYPYKKIMFSTESDMRSLPEDPVMEEIPDPDQLRMEVEANEPTEQEIQDSGESRIYEESGTDSSEDLDQTRMEVDHNEFTE